MEPRGLNIPFYVSVECGEWSVESGVWSYFRFSAFFFLFFCCA